MAEGAELLRTRKLTRMLHYMVRQQEKLSCALDPNCEGEKGLQIVGLLGEVCLGQERDPEGDLLGCKHPLLGEGTKSSRRNWTALGGHIWSISIFSVQQETRWH